MLRVLAKYSTKTDFDENSPPGVLIIDTAIFWVYGYMGSVFLELCAKNFSAEFWEINTICSHLTLTEYTRLLLG